MGYVSGGRFSWVPNIVRGSVWAKVRSAPFQQALNAQWVKVRRGRGVTPNQEYGFHVITVTLHGHYLEIALNTLGVEAKCTHDYMSDPRTGLAITKCFIDLLDVQRAGLKSKSCLDRSSSSSLSPTCPRATPELQATRLFSMGVGSLLRY